MREYEKAQKDNKQPTHLNVFQGFLSDADSGIYSNQTCKLLQILIATPYNTLCVERGYSSFTNGDAIALSQLRWAA